MTPVKSTKEEQGRPLLVPLVVVTLILVVIAVGMGISHKVQRSDPTFTAAPKTGAPGVYLMASPQKLAFEQQLRKKMDAEVMGVKR